MANFSRFEAILLDFEQERDDWGHGDGGRREIKLFLTYLSGHTTISHASSARSTNAWLPTVVLGLNKKQRTSNSKVSLSL